jgi:lipopolysaccharide assembly outer membrane protein LptD (OstA)
VFLVLVHSLCLFSQEELVMADTLTGGQTETLNDTVPLSLRSTSDNAIDSEITYSAAGSRKVDIKNNKIILVDEAVVNYGEMEINADSIIFDMNTNLVFAIGRKDSTGKTIGSPSFKEGANEFDAEELTYNFKTGRAFIKNIVTRQEDGLLHSTYTKLLEDGTSNIAKSTYSTCDADTPHYYINLPKARVYPEKKIISGPGNLVLEGIPLPLFIPFGYFPIQTKEAESGILIPRIGEERLRGFSLTDGGYYFAINDYLDLTLKGSLYSNGTWLASAQTNYNKLYKYSGNFSFSYANNISGHKGLPDYSKSSNYKIGWTFTQDPKAMPGARFSASVNMSSSGYDRNNSYEVTEHVTTQRQSSVSFSKSWQGAPINLSASMYHSQNVKNNSVSLNLPKVNFNVARIYPLKGRRSAGSTKWYQELQFQYSASIDNKIDTKDSLLFTGEVWNDMRNGFKHEAPLSLQIRPFKNFSIFPSLTYSGVLFTSRLEKRWDPDPDNPSVVTDTIKGFSYGHAIKPSISASYNPQIFGTFQFTNPNSRLQTIRHVIKPSVGFSYVPLIKGFSSDMYRQVQVDTAGNTSEYSIFENYIFSTPSLARKSGNLSFQLVNILEAKRFARDDTTGKPEKIKLIENLSVNTSYNIFADSMRWAPVNMSLRTTVLDKINISANSSFSLYSLDCNGAITGRFMLAENKKLMRLTSFYTSVSFSLSELLRGDETGRRTAAVQQIPETSGSQAEGYRDEQNQALLGSGTSDQYGYQIFDIPWSMNISYNFRYSKPNLTSKIKQTMSLNGNASITRKMSITYRSGYDFTDKKITMTQLGITRDLHCWEMSFNWIPNGTMKSWNFTIRIKAPVLADLKYERKKDFHDDY